MTLFFNFIVEALNCAIILCQDPINYLLFITRRKKQNNSIINTLYSDKATLSAKH